MQKAFGLFLLLLSLCLACTIPGFIIDRIFVTGRYLIGYSRGSFVCDWGVRDCDFSRPVMLDLPLLPTA
jgi:hypothetical protein